MKPPRADARRSHLFGVFEWRLYPDHFERLDRRGYRRLFDRTFYDEIESVTVFREPDPLFFFRGLLIATITVPWLLMLKIGFRTWTVPLAVAGGSLAVFVVALGALAFGRGKTRILFRTRFGDREIVVNRSAAFVRRFMSRLVPLVRSAQRPAPAPVLETESPPGTAGEPEPRGLGDRGPDEGSGA